MASYYVDITEDTGIGDGLSSVNYWGWNEFSARALSGILPDTDSYYMKGYRQFSEDLIFSAQNDGIYFYGWDGNAFIFDFTNTNQISFTGTMNNVIIQNMVSNAAAIRHNDRNFQMTIINSILLRDEGTLTVEGTYDPGDHGFDFCGCTIETNGILLDTDGQYEFENCLITSGTSISANEPNTHLQLRSCSLPGVANMAALTAGSPNDYTDIDDENNIYNAVLGSSLPTSADLQTLSGDGIRDNLNFTAFNVDSTLSGNSALWSMNTSYETTAYGNPTSGYIQGDVWQYNYSYGFKGTPRRGVGAFYFGGPYYIDLNATLPAIYEPSKANQYIYLSAYGTSADPFNYAQFFLSSQIYHGWEEWQFKGDISITSAVGGLFTFANDPNWRREFALLTGANVGEYIFNSWDLSANDLWRVNIVSGDYGIIYDGMTGTNVTIRDALISISGNDYGATAIMRTPSDANKNVTFYNSQIYVTLKGVPYLIVGSGENNRKYFYGSTIVLNDEGIADFQWGGSSFEDPVLICDCVLKADTSLNFNSNATSAYTITNIETNLSQVDLSGCTLSGNVYESTALTAIPDMIDDYDKNDFIYNNYAITVTATSAFTDYPTGIGALDRYGVGAFYFLPPPPQCFSADVSAGDVPLAVIFTTARGSGFTSATYMWDFGDGDTSSTTSASIAHTFTSAGSFTVQLTVTGTSAITDYATYIEQDFNTISGQASAMNPAWDPDFSAAAEAGGVIDATGQAYSACCGEYGTYMNGSTPDWIIASGDSLSGDFNFETSILWDGTAGGDSHHFWFTSAYGDTGAAAKFAEYLWWNNTLYWYTTDATSATVSISSSAWNCLWLKVKRVDGEISAAYRSCPDTEWTWLSTTQTFSGEMWVYTDEYTNNGIGYIGFSAEAGLPYDLPYDLSVTATSVCSGDIIANTTIGHIGAFYFGPVDASPTFSAATMELVAYTPLATGEQSVSSDVPGAPTIMVIRAYAPTVLTIDGLRVYFVGMPRKGTSPLCVDYEAFVEWHPAYADKYIITEYKWWFDYANFSAAEDGVVSECGGTPSSTISHIHQGQPGQTYDVRLCVQISPV